MTFENLNLIEPLLKALRAEGYTQPTPVQEKAIPILLQGKDLLGSAQTGTGKTAAFALPILQHLYEKQAPLYGPRPIRALIVTPTRELAVQINESFASYGKFTSLKHTVVYGGVSQHGQTIILRKGIDTLVATPGRLLDLINQRIVSLNNIEYFVLDEADRMLDMGFIHDVKKIIARLPVKRQSLCFSATLPSDIQKLAGQFLDHPVKVEIAPVVATANLIMQSLYFVDKKDKKSLLLHLLKDDVIDTALVFTRTKHNADKISKDLVKAGIKADAIHGNKSQGARQLALNNFKNKRTRVLVATDIAARGIDVEELSHVINFEIPETADMYIHRIGRTGRAGVNGAALSFCDNAEKSYLKDIYKLISKTIPVVEDHPYPATGGTHSLPANRAKQRGANKLRISNYGLRNVRHQARGNRQQTAN
jgi:ATP-dependent RNA helicase RhlE